MSDVDNPGSPGNTDRRIAGTFFRDSYARFKEPFSLTPDALVELVETFHRPQKSALRWIKLASFGELKTAKGSLRHDGNVLSITGVEADYDKGEIAFDDMVEKLEAAGIEAIAYTSPSHREDKPRWRILAPLSQPRDKVERAKFLARLNGLFEGALGAESFTLSQSYYFGYVGNGAQAPATHRAKYVAGQFIDLRDDLDAGAIGKSGKAKKDGNPYEQYGEESGERLDFKATVAGIVSGGDFHDPMKRAIASMIGRGVERLVVTNNALAIYEAACLKRPELKTRGGEQEVRKLIDWTYEQEEKKQQPQPQPDKTLPPDISIDDFYAYLPKHWYLYVPTQTLWPPATIGSRLGKIGTVKATRWLDRERAVSQMIWAPGEPQIVKGKHLIEGGWVEKEGAIVFNQYRSGNIPDGDPALATPWIELVKYLWPTVSEHEHIIRTLAFKIQNPAIKINHALVLGGGMRIGKDTMLVPIKKILGAWNCVEAKPTTIMSNFNGYMRSTLLMINEARDLGEVKRHEFYLHMKDVIVTPPNTVLVNEKHEKAIHAANVCLVIMTTNHRTDGIYLPPDDGRHFPVWSDRSREDYPIDYFDRFYDWIDNGGVPHIAAYLRSINVSDYRPGRPPPQTDLFHEIVQASTPIETLWLGDILTQWANELSSPPVFILDSLVRRADQSVKEWLLNPGNRKSIPYRLAECGYTRIPRTGVGDGRWTVSGNKQNIYGPKDLSHEERLRRAQELE